MALWIYHLATTRLAADGGWLYHHPDPATLDPCAPGGCRARVDDRNGRAASKRSAILRCAKTEDANRAAGWRRRAAIRRVADESILICAMKITGPEEDRRGIRLLTL